MVPVTRLVIAAAIVTLAGCESPGPRDVVIDPLARLPPAQSQQTRIQTPPVRPAAESASAADSVQEQVSYGRMPRVGAIRPDAERVEGGAYTINFSEAQLEEVAQIILGDLLDEPYLVDPRVTGRITASTPRPVSRDALLALFEATLAMNNASLVRADGVYRILPAGEAQASGLGRLSDPGRPGWGVSVVPLRYVSASNMRQLLDSVVTRSGAVRADTARNLILIVGSSGERSNAANAIAAFDVDWMAGMSIALIPLVNATPDTVIAEMDAIFQSSGDGASAGSLRLQSVDRLNAVLAVAASPQLLDRAREWAARLDMGGASGSTLRSYFLENGKAVETADLLNQLLGAGAPISSGVSPDLGEATARTAPARASSGAAGEGGYRVIADPINNALLVLADAPGHAMVERALMALDRTPAQVLIDAVIAEVTLNDTLRYGVQFYFESGGLDRVGDTSRGGFSTGDSFQPSPTFPGFNFVIESAGGPRFTLDALSRITDLTVVSSPSVMVLDNQTASFRVGDQVPVVTRTSSSVINPDSPLVSTVEYRDTGVILVVSPRVSSTGRVTLTVTQEVSNVSRAAAGAGLTPTISTRNVDTTVSVNSGQTIVLAGLIDENRDAGRRGLPLINRIPGLRDALSSTEVVTSRTELVIFLTPRVIYNDDDVASATEDLRRRMELLRPEG
ncbi:type II secretion system secretin GspD [Hyphomonadaceae bacterium ML37]|nr:type II secretion system secretin GspD [Hyphomonadaceae bacterium ML37]